MVSPYGYRLHSPEVTKFQGFCFSSLHFPLNRDEDFVDSRQFLTNEKILTVLCINYAKEMIKCVSRYEQTRYGKDLFPRLQSVKEVLLYRNTPRPVYGTIVRPSLALSTAGKNIGIPRVSICR